MVQLPLTAALSVALFLAWLVVSKRLPSKLRPLPDVRDGFRTYLLSFAWGAALFVPLHFLFTGYLTGIGNLAALWGLQLPINAVAIVAGTNVLRSGRFGAAGRPIES